MKELTVSGYCDHCGARLSYESPSVECWFRMKHEKETARVRIICNCGRDHLIVVESGGSPEEEETK